MPAPSRRSEPWPVVARQLRKGLDDRLRAFAEQTGASEADLIDLAVTALLPDSDGGGQDPEPAVAQRMIDQMRAAQSGRRGTAITGLYEVALPPEADVVVVRLGPSRDDPHPTPPGGYRRTSWGADISDDPHDVWEAARGYWDLAAPLPRFLIATRLGRVLAAFEVQTWHTLDDGSRVWAESGRLLDARSGRSRPVGSGRARRSAPLTAQQEAITEAFPRGRLIAYPPGVPKSRYRIGAAASARREAVTRSRAKTASREPARARRAR